MALVMMMLLLVIFFFSAALPSSSQQPLLIRQVTTDDDSELLQGLSGIPIHASAHLRSPHALFKRFISLYHRSYSSPTEYAYRFRIFKHNLLKASRIQLLDPSAVHGVTNFSDLTHQEFARSYLGLNSPPFVKPAAEAVLLPTDDLPSEFDWRDHGAVSEVKNQGLCGSCWAFSTTGAVEGAHYVATGKLISLSEQQLVDCDHECDSQNACDSGCRGGLMTSAYSYILKAGGLQLEKDYPYRGLGGKCKFDASKAAAKIANFSTIVVDEDQIAANLVKNGPLAIGINAVFMQTYIGGVSCPYVCSKRRLDHGVLLVGYGENGYTPIRLKEKSYWIIKNSWGPHWGDKGYYKICRGYNECGMDTMVSSVAAAIVH